MRHDVEIRVLGSFAVERAGKPVVLTSSRQRALLAALGMAAGESVPIQALACAVWQLAPPERAKASLHTLVSRLRRLLGDDLIGTTADGYRLCVDANRIDAGRFLNLLDAANSAPRPDIERTILQEALAQWNGEPVIPAPGIIERYLAAVQRRVDLDILAGDLEGVAAELTDLIADFPLWESLWERLIRTYVATGRRAEALAAYAECRRLLAEQLGVTPCAALRELHLELLATDDGAAANPSSTTMCQLPETTERFIGHAPEFEALDQILADRDDGEPTIAVLDGAAGMGKTTLAVRWALARNAAFDTELFIDLHGHADTPPMTTAEALGQLLLALDIPATEIPSESDARAILLRGALANRPRALVVLDNVRNADQIRPLLPGPGTLVLVTSRNQLRGLVAREGAKRISVRELSTAEAVDLFEATIGRSPADTDTATDRDADRAVVAQLTERCGRIPHAVVLAASRVTRLGEEVTLTSVSQEIQVEIHPELSAALSWSYRALSVDAARVFRMLGLIPDPQLRPESVAALCDLPMHEATGLLDELVGANLVHQLTSKLFHIHNPFRAYAGTLVTTEPAEVRAAAVRRLAKATGRRPSAVPADVVPAVCTR